MEVGLVALLVTSVRRARARRRDNIESRVDQLMRRRSRRFKGGETQRERERRNEKDGKHILTLLNTPGNDRKRCMIWF